MVEVFEVWPRSQACYQLRFTSELGLNFGELELDLNDGFGCVL